MRTTLNILFLAALLFGGGYWFYIAEAVCDTPLTYRIGTIDERFNLTEDEVQNAIFGAESLWEDKTGRNLFTYDVSGKVTINFVFDERQQRAIEEEQLREALDTKEGMSESVRAQYETLLKKYQDLKVQYEKRVAVYEDNLASYNNEVADWNGRGGAPADVFQRLGSTKDALAEEQKLLNATASELNELVRKMNILSAKGNSLITDYNQTVEEYNDRVGEAGEFTQGEYSDKVINIYQYDSLDELEIVLAHEFGHALSLNHVEGTESVMFHLMEEQTSDTGITDSDLAEFVRVCGTEASFPNVVRAFIRSLLST